MILTMLVKHLICFSCEFFPFGNVKNYCLVRRSRWAMFFENLHPFSNVFNSGKRTNIVFKKQNFKCLTNNVALFDQGILCMLYLSVFVIKLCKGKMLLWNFSFLSVITLPYSRLRINFRFLRVIELATVSVSKLAIAWPRHLYPYMRFPPDLLSWNFVYKPCTL